MGVNVEFTGKGRRIVENIWVGRCLLTQISEIGGKSPV